MREERKWYRDIVFDTLRINPAGFDENLFEECRKFPDGEEKISGLHTNMCQNGCLGTPREFKVYYWGVSFEQAGCKQDVQKVLQNLKLRLVFGSNVTMQESSLSVFTPTLFVTDGLASGPIQEGYRINHKVDDWKVFNEQVGDCLKRFNLEGVWTHYHRAVFSETYEPLHLDSVTSFRVQATMLPVELTRPVVLKVMLMGMELRYGSPPW